MLGVIFDLAFEVAVVIEAEANDKISHMTDPKDLFSNYYPNY